MFVTIQSLETYYEVYGSGRPMVFLHGWGGSVASFKPFYNHFSEHFQVFTIDLPGFGQTQEPDQSWDLLAYAQWFKDFLESLSIEKPIVIAHSFGGRIVIKASKLIEYERIILTGAGGIKPKRSVGYYLKVYSFKAMKHMATWPILKRLLEPKMRAYRQRVGSSDYQQATDVMKGVISLAVNEDLRGFLPEIKAPTLLIWGELDTATPLKDGQLIADSLPDGGLVVFEGGTHFAYLEQKDRFMTVVDYFLKDLVEV